MNIESIFQLIVPALIAMTALGLAVAAALWGEDSALPAGHARDGRAVRWSLPPDRR